MPSLAELLAGAGQSPPLGAVGKQLPPSFALPPQARQPGVIERNLPKVYDPLQQQQQEVFKHAMDLTPMGAIADGYDAIQQSDPTGLATAAIGLMPIPGARGVSAVKKGLNAMGDVGMGIRAYHGSPHDFDKFDLSKIGTGEGAQAYGHGLYFAENEGVARSYKRPGPHSHIVPTTIDDVPVSRFSAGNDAEKRAADALARNPTIDEAIKYLQQDRGTEAAQQWLLQNAGRVKDASKTGKMYEVNINAHPDQFLDWDKPLSGQGEAIRSVLDPIKSKLQSSGNPYVPAQLDSVGAIIQNGRAALGERRIEPSLLEAGIPGIKYLDQGSRTPKAMFDGKPIPADNIAAQQASEWLGLYGSPEAAIKAQSTAVKHPYTEKLDRDAIELLKSGAVKNHFGGSSNYVVFNDQLIDILKKYGIAPMGGTAALSQLQPEPQQ